MLEGENIICFAKDWSEDPTSNNHVMRLLARKNRVLWLNSIAMRTPNLASKSDLTKIARKLRSFTQGPVEVAPNLFVYTPIVLPFPHSDMAAAVNHRVLRSTLGFLRGKLDMNEYQLWTFLPTSLPYLEMPGEKLVVYYCTDEWSRFSYLNGQRMGELEETLCRRADVVFTTARNLYDKRKAWNRETHLALHGVEHGHFATALDDATTVPDELVGCPRPIIGFFGLIHDWIDISLLAYVAEKRPEWTVAVVGKADVDTSILQRLPNVKLLGRKPYAELPRYCKAFSVGTMPFALNELTQNVNPIKMREYLSAGLPVVSTDLPEVRGYSEHCRIAHGKEEFLAACDQAVMNDTPELRRQRSASMATETWEAKVDQLGAAVLEAQARRQVERKRAA